MANIFPSNVLNRLRGHVRPADRNPAGGRGPPAQNVFGDAPEENTPEPGPKESKTQGQDGECDTDFGDAPDRPFTPSPIDIYVVRAMIAKAKSLPVDIVDLIFDYAEYWAHSSNEIDYTVEHQSAMRVAGRSPTENKFILRSYPVGLLNSPPKMALSEELSWDLTESKPLPLKKEQEPEYFKKMAKYPLPKLVNPVRKVVFSIRSRDQGFGGDIGCKGTYKGSWTWFEAGLEKFDAENTCEQQCTYDVRHRSTTSKASELPVCGLRPLYPEIEPDAEHQEFKYHHTLFHNEKHEICRNRTATRSYENRVVTWSWTDSTHAESDEAIKADEQEGRGRGTLDGEFVRNLKLGDVVTVWAMARFPAWVNHIEKVKVEIYWAV